jgi:hypothetical protein
MRTGENDYPQDTARTYFLQEAEEVFMHLCDQLSEVRFAEENKGGRWVPDYQEAGGVLESLCAAFALHDRIPAGPNLMAQWGSLLEMTLRIGQLLLGARKAPLDLLDWNDALGDIHRLHDLLHDAENAKSDN